MKTLSSKRFKKKYASSMDNVPEKGVWSGRGIAIPAGGALDGSGDGSKYLGRPRRPYYDGESGSPSQSADSTFSSYLARVNKGREEDYYSVMFPEQEQEDEDSYSMDTVDPISSRKLPRSFKVVRGRAMFEESDIVENSRYSLKDVSEGVVGQIVGDIAGDVGAAALGAIPIIGMGATGGLIAFNISQLSGDMQDADIAIEAFRMDPNDDTVQELDDVLDAMSINLIDLLQRTLELLPDAETPTGEAASVLTSIIDNLRKVATSLGLMGGGASTASNLWGKVKVVGIVTPVLKFFMEILDSGQAPESIRANQSVILAVPRKMILLGDLQEDYWMQKEAAERVGQPFVYTNRVITPEFSLQSYDYENSPMRNPETLQSPSQPQPSQPGQPQQPTSVSQQGSPAERSIPASAAASLSQEDLYRLILTGRAPQMSESKNKKSLRSFIRESLKTDMMPIYQSQMPHGYQYRRPNVIVAKDAERDEFESLESYDDVSVAYKTDGGTVAYQTRNTVKESSEIQALRSIIRGDIQSLMSESEKKK